MTLLPKREAEAEIVKIITKYLLESGHRINANNLSVELFKEEASASYEVIITGAKDEVTRNSVDWLLDNPPDPFTTDLYNIMGW